MGSDFLAYLLYSKEMNTGTLQDYDQRMLTGDNVYDTIWNAKSTGEIFGICYHFIHHFPGLAIMRRRQTELLHLDRQQQQQQQHCCYHHLQQMMNCFHGAPATRQEAKN